MIFINIILIYTADIPVILVTIDKLMRDYVILVVKNVMDVQEKEPKTASSAQVIILTLMAHV